jgi:Na+-driven multidrug efflux pump
MAPSYGGYGLVMAMCSAFNGVGRPLPAVLISATRVFFLFLPLAWAGRELLGLNGVFAASSLSNIAVGALAFAWFGAHVARHRQAGA